MSSLSRNARIAGFLYILASAVAIVRLLYVPSVLFVRGNAAATVANIVAHESLFRAGIVCYLVGGTLWLFVPIALYRLLNEVDHHLAVLMVILGSLMQTPLYIFNTFTDAGALLLIHGDFPQRDAWAMLFLRLHHQIDLADMMFAGLWLIPFGLLVYRSGFLPRFLGGWLTVACLPYIGISVFGTLSPGSEDLIFKYGQPLMLAEVAAMFWLLIMGVSAKRLAELPQPA